MYTYAIVSTIGNIALLFLLVGAYIASKGKGESLTPPKERRINLKPYQDFKQQLHSRMLDAKPLYIYLAKGIPCRDLAEFLNGLNELYRAHGGQELRAHLPKNEHLILKPFDEADNEL